MTIPTLQEVARAARSAEKLFDTLNREFPPTLEAIRLTGQEVGELTDDLNQGISKRYRSSQTGRSRVSRSKTTGTASTRQQSRISRWSQSCLEGMA